MKVLTLLVTLLTSSYCVKAQDTIYKKGIYGTFQELKSNNPSLELKYPVKTTSDNYGFMGTGGKVTFYLFDARRRDLNAIENLYGFSDGQYLYVMVEDAGLFRRSPKFSRIEKIGKYFYYPNTLTTTTYNGKTGSSYTSLQEEIINSETGETTILTKSSIRKLIESDKELLNQFNDETRKNKKLKDYLIMFVEKNK